MALHRGSIVLIPYGESTRLMMTASIQAYVYNLGCKQLCDSYFIEASDSWMQVVVMPR